MHRELDSDLEAKRNHRLVNRERRAHRALRIVAMGERRAEDRHHVVADMFVDRAAETLHHHCRAIDQLGHDLAQPLRTDCRRDLHGMNNIGE